MAVRFLPRIFEKRTIEIAGETERYRVERTGEAAADVTVSEGVVTEQESKDGKPRAKRYDNRWDALPKGGLQIDPREIGFLRRCDRLCDIIDGYRLEQGQRVVVDGQPLVRLVFRTPFEEQLTIDCDLRRNGLPVAVTYGNPPLVYSRCAITYDEVATATGPAWFPKESVRTIAFVGRDLDAGPPAQTERIRVTSFQQMDSPSMEVLPVEPLPEGTVIKDRRSNTTRTVQAAPAAATPGAYWVMLLATVIAIAILAALRYRSLSN